jgi:RNA polymerase sigma factor (sigma-70 family)
MYSRIRIQLRSFAFKKYAAIPGEVLADCVSDTIVDLVEKPPPQEVSANQKILLSWAIEILKRKVYHVNIRAAHFTPLESSHDIPVEPDILTTIETKEIIDDALRSLTDKERSVVLMKNYGCYSYKRMAYICKVSTNAVKGLLVSAKKKMQTVGNPPPAIIVPN